MSRPKLNHRLFAAAGLCLSACVYYTHQDYIRYEGLDFDPYRKIYFTTVDRETTKADKVFAFRIGMKRLAEFQNDRARASSEITRAVMNQEGFCEGGYRIQYDPDPSRVQGDFGFGWEVFCN